MMYWIRVKNEAMDTYQESFVQLDLVLKPLSTVISGNFTVRLSTVVSDNFTVRLSTKPLSTVIAGNFTVRLSTVISGNFTV